jgi:hypothetical protein
MRARDLHFESESMIVRPWVDPVVDDIGHDPRSPYVERFWLGILGPSTTFLLRHLVERLDAAPEGFDLHLSDCATTLGLGRLQGRGAAFPRTIGRSCQFGAARLPGGPVLEVRRRLPPLTLRQVRRLPRPRQAEHARWLDRASATLSDIDRRDRARRLALSMVHLGEGRAGTEHQLLRWRVPPPLAAEATEWALAHDAARRGTTLPPLVVGPATPAATATASPTPEPTSTPVVAATATAVVAAGMPALPVAAANPVLPTTSATGRALPPPAPTG